MPLSRLGLYNEKWCFLIELTNWTSPSPKIQGSCHVHLGIPEIFLNIKFSTNGSGGL